MGTGGDIPIGADDQGLDATKELSGNAPDAKESLTSVKFNQGG